MQQARSGGVVRGHAGRQPADAGGVHFIRKVAPTSAPVLILGESGTGKEMVAQALHRRSPQQERPVHRHQLQRDTRESARERAVRPREGRLHRRARAAQGAHRSGCAAERSSWTRSVSCRTGAGEAAAFSAGEAFPACRRPAGDSERYPGDCGHERESARSRSQRQVSRGSVFPAGSRCREGAAAARARRRHRPHGEGIPAPLRRTSTASGC